jgi:hypothetical protein
MAKKPAKPASSAARSSTAAKKKAPAKSSKVGKVGGSPLIDTNLAANAAAAFVGRKISLNGPAAPKQESAAFKHLKENVSKPHMQGLNNVLDTTNQNKKPNLPFGGGKQVAHNQTFGADVNRSGVPRRTPG